MLKHASVSILLGKHVNVYEYEIHVYNCIHAYVYELVIVCSI